MRLALMAGCRSDKLTSTLVSMRSYVRTLVVHFVTYVCIAGPAAAQTRVSIHIIDENGVSIPEAVVSIQSEHGPSARLRTDYLGRSEFVASPNARYSVRIERPGFYVFSLNSVDLAAETEFSLVHQQQIQQEINVVGSPPVIDPEQPSDAARMQTPEIVNVPYPTSRDIRNLLPFNPGVVPDPQSNQAHVAGSETRQTLDLLDGFNVTSPVDGTLSMRFSTDAVRSIEVQSTRYPVEYGRASGGIISFRSGMGDDRFRFNATNFIPSFKNRKGLTFDKFVPRLTFAGPLRKRTAWFYDGLELEYDNVVIPELPEEANTNRPWRGSNLAKFQVNVTPANLLSFGALVNLSRSEFDGISPLNPQSATIRREITGGLAFIRDQHAFRDGTVLETAIAGLAFDDASTPHGTGAYVITAEGVQGSYFESSKATSHRIEEKADVYVSPQRWAGRHVLKIGANLNEIQYGQDASRRPINYLRTDDTLLRQSTFPSPVDIAGNNFEAGAYLQDQYSPSHRWLMEAGVRFDWDRIIGHGVVSPRIAVTYAFGNESMTKISAGIGIYYDRTALDLIERTQQGPRLDTTFAPDGITPTGRPVESLFTYAPDSLHFPRTLNWSVGMERKLAAEILLRTNFIQKRGFNQFTFINMVEPDRSLYVLRNARRDHYDSFEITLRRTFARDYSLFGSYVRSSATTNAGLDYTPTLSILGPQAGGPLPWDAPNRLISWGWLPVPKTRRLDFVFAMDWHSGYPFTSVNVNHELAGSPSSHRFPDYFSFSPGLEVRFRVRKTYFGLRGVAENITGHKNPLHVNNVVDSPNYLSFSDKQGRAFTARIRIIGSN